MSKGKFGYSATSPISGETFTRCSNRVYTHCVVAHIAAQPADGNWTFRPAKRLANWSGSLALAQKAARGWTSPVATHVEILPAERAS